MLTMKCRRSSNHITAKKFRGFALLFFLFSNCLCQFAFGWGGYGHRAVAAIAERLVAPQTEKAIKSLLGKNGSLVDIALWADEIKGERKETAPWHYVDMPKESNIYTAERDCPENGCLLSAIENFQYVLSDKKATRYEREEALKFIVHFIADLHQPLHCGYAEDNGGNRINVSFFGEGSNLHKVWDSGIISRNEIKFDVYVEKQVQKATPDVLSKLQKGTVLDWFYESRGLLKDYVYAFGSSRFLRQDYYNKNLPIVNYQLLKAAVRLAGVLDKALSEKKK